MPGIFDFFKGIVSPITNLIDEMHTSTEEKLNAKAQLLVIQTQLADKVLDYESKIVEAQSKVVIAEATGQSWLQRNWRPLLMTCFTAIVVNNYIISPIFGTPPAILPDHMWTLMEIGVGGYIVGRSAEKIVPGIVGALKSKEE